MVRFNPNDKSYKFINSGHLSKEDALKLKSDVLSHQGRRIVLLHGEGTSTLRVGAFTKNQIKEARKQGYTVNENLDKFAEKLDNLAKKQIGSIAHTYTSYRKDAHFNAQSKRFCLCRADKKQKRINQAAEGALGLIGSHSPKSPLQEDIQEVIQNASGGQILYYDYETDTLKTADPSQKDSLGDTACLDLCESIRQFLKKQDVCLDVRLNLGQAIISQIHNYPTNEITDALNEIATSEQNHIQEVIQRAKNGHILYYDYETDTLKTTDPSQKNSLGENACSNLSKSIHYFLTNREISYEDKIELAASIAENSKNYPSSEVSKALEFLLKGDTEKPDGHAHDILGKEDGKPKHTVQKRGQLIRQLFKAAKHLPSKQRLALQYQLVSMIAYMGRSTQDVGQMKSLKGDQKAILDPHDLALSMTPEERVEFFKEIKQSETDWPNGAKPLINAQLNRILSPEAYHVAIKDLVKEFEEGVSAHNQMGGKSLDLLHDIEAMPGFKAYLKSLDPQQEIYKSFKKLAADLKKDSKGKLEASKKETLKKRLQAFSDQFEVLISSPKPPQSDAPKTLPDLSDITDTLTLNRETKRLETTNEVASETHIEMGPIDIAILGALRSNQYSAQERVRLAESLLERKKATQSSKEKKEIERALEHLLTFSKTDQNTLGNTPKERLASYYALKGIEKKVKPKFAKSAGKFQSLDKFAESVFKDEDYHEAFGQFAIAMRNPKLEHIKSIKQLPGIKKYFKKRSDETSKLFDSMCRNLSKGLKSEKHQEALEKGKTSLTDLVKKLNPTTSVSTVKFAPSEDVQVTISPIQSSRYSNTKLDIELYTQPEEIHDVQYGKIKTNGSKPSKENKIISAKISLHGQEVQVMGVAKGNTKISESFQEKFPILFQDAFNKRASTAINEKAIKETAMEVITQIHNDPEIDSKNIPLSNFNINILVPKDDHTTDLYNISAGDSETHIVNEQGEIKTSVKNSYQYQWEYELSKTPKGRDILDGIKTWNLDRLKLFYVLEQSKVEEPETGYNREKFQEAAKKVGLTANSVRFPQNQLQTENAFNDFLNTDLNIDPTYQSEITTKLDFNRTLRYFLHGNPENIAYEPENGYFEVTYSTGDSPDEKITARLYPEVEVDEMDPNTGEKANKLATAIVLNPQEGRRTFNSQIQSDVSIASFNLNEGERVITASDALRDATEIKAAQKIIEKRINDPSRKKGTDGSHICETIDKDGNKLLLDTSFESGYQVVGIAVGKDNEGQIIYETNPQVCAKLLIHRYGTDEYESSLQDILKSDSPREAIESICSCGEIHDATVVMTSIPAKSGQYSDEGDSYYSENPLIRILEEDPKVEGRIEIEDSEDDSDM